MESKIQSKIKSNLEKSGWLVLKVIQLSSNGYPDLFCFKDGRTIFVEVKAIGKQPDPLQLLRHSELRKKGFDVFVTDDKNFTLDK